MSYTFNDSDFNCTVEENTRLAYDLIRLQHDTNKHCNQVDHIYESCTLTRQDNPINNTESCIQRFHSYCEVTSDSRSSNKKAPCKLFEIKRNEDCFCIKPNEQDNQVDDYTQDPPKFPKSSLQCVCLLSDKNVTISERQRHINTTYPNCTCPIFFRKACNVRHYNESIKSYSRIFCEIKDTSAPFEHFLLGYNGPINITTTVPTTTTTTTTTIPTTITTTKTTTEPTTITKTVKEIITTDNNKLSITPDVDVTKLDALGTNSGFIVGISIASFMIIFLALLFLGATKYGRNRQLERYKLALLREQILRLQKYYQRDESGEDSEVNEEEEESDEDEEDGEEEESEEDESEEEESNKKKIMTNMRKMKKSIESIKNKTI